MEIRSVTVFTNLSLDEPELALAQAANFLHNAVATYEAAGFRVQSRRVATQPFPRILAPAGPELAVAFASRVQEIARDYGIDYVSLGPANASDVYEYVDVIPDMIAATDAVFLGISIADLRRGFHTGLIQHAAEVIQRVSALTPDGLSNLFLAALANVKPGAPFFPAAYHKDGASPAFALAVQAADLAVQAFRRPISLKSAELKLTDAVTTAAQDLTRVAGKLADEFDLKFGGLDFSLAPYPDDAISLGAAFERLGVSMGGGGGAAAAALIMTALDKAHFKRAGFNGLMLPVLEDSVLARRASGGALTTTDLLLYSAICGTGLDTIPLPGDTSVEALSGLLLDTAALALRLDKPLTARLMPLPGKAAGDDSGLESFEYFAPARVMAAPVGLTPGGLLADDDAYRVKARLQRR